MKKGLLLFMSCCSFVVFGQTFSWSGQFLSADASGSVGVGVDASGNVVTGGNFGGSIDIDPSSGTVNLSSNGAYDGFISIVNSGGNYVAGFAIGSGTTDYLGDVAVSPAGDVFVTGRFTGTVDFDPGAGSTTLSSTDPTTYDVYIAKYTITGSLVWCKSFGAAGHEMGRSLTVDASGNVTAIGEFGGTIDLNPGGGVNNVTSNGQSDVYVVKLDGSGNFVWGGSVGGGSVDLASSVASDASGNIYFVGNFTGAADLDPTGGNYSLTSSGDFDSFIIKLTPTGTLDWAESFGGVNGDAVGDICISPLSEVLVVGSYINAADLNPTGGMFAVTSNGDREAYCLKVDTDGNFMWAKSFGGDVSDECKAVSCNSTGDVYMTGYFNHTVDFDPNGGVQLLTSASGHVDGYVLKLTASGNFSSVNQLNGTSDMAGWAIMAKAGNLYSSGMFSGTSDFDPQAGVYTLSNTQFSGNAYTFKWQQ